MTLSNRDRAVRCQRAITVYSDDDAYTNLVDFLADAFHWCRTNGHSFPDALDTALMHFEAEIASDDDVIHDFNHNPTEERNQSMAESETEHYEIDEKLLRSVIDDAEQAFWHAVAERFPQATSGDLSPLTVARLTIVAQEAIAEWIDLNVPTTTNKGD
jgi:hypothetical protein